MTSGNGASLYSSFSNYPPEMFRVSGMPIKSKIGHSSSAPLAVLMRFW
jgi:hypothetical protein